MRRIGWFLVIVVLALALVGCQGDEPDEETEPGIPAEGFDSEEEARTFYEGLNLDTPEDAARTLAEAWANDDFETVYFILAPAAQSSIRERFRLATFGPLLDDELEDDVSTEMVAAIQESEEDIWVLFDDVMEIADQSEALLLDLSGDLQVQSTEDSLTATGQDAVDVIATVEGMQGPVLFRTVQSGDGPWRVFKIMAEEAGVDQFPWPDVSTEEDITEEED